MDNLREHPFVSVVIPVYNEGSHIAEVIKSIQMHLEHLNGSFEMIIVDDRSTDNTWIELQNAVTSNPHIRAIRLSRNFGKESALCAGLENAQGDGIIIIDGDLQHPPELIPQMVLLWKNENLDIVEAVKSKRSKETWYNRIGSHVFYSSIKFLTGFDFRGASDFKLLDRRALKSLLDILVLAVLGDEIIGVWHHLLDMCLERSKSLVLFEHQDVVDLLDIKLPG